MKKASCSWFSACRPWSQGNTCLVGGSGCEAKWSSDCDNWSGVIEYTGGSLNSFAKPLGGCVSDVVSIKCVGEGGEAGGVSSCRDAGRGPGEQKGRCLFGTGAGVPRFEVLMDNCGGGVAVRSGSNGLVSTVVAMLSLVLAISRCRRLVSPVAEQWCCMWFTNYEASARAGHTVR